MSNYTFEDLPGVVATLVEEIKGLRQIVDERLSMPKAAETKEWMTLKDIQEYHPEHPAATTIYGWVRNGLIPYYKKGKKLTFKKSEIDRWIEDARQKTDAELQEDAVNHINQRRLAR